MADASEHFWGDRPGWASARSKLRTMAMNRAAGKPLSESVTSHNLAVEILQKVERGQLVPPLGLPGNVCFI